MKAHDQNGGAQNLEDFEDDDEVNIDENIHENEGKEGGAALWNKIQTQMGRNPQKMSQKDEKVEYDYSMIDELFAILD